MIFVPENKQKMNFVLKFMLAHSHLVLIRFESYGNGKRLLEDDSV